MAAGGSLKITSEIDAEAAYAPNSLSDLTFAEDRVTDVLRYVRESNNLISNEGMIRPPAPKGGIGRKSRIPVSIKLIIGAQIKRGIVFEI